MKKIVLLIITLLLPINILAYSKEVIPGGENIGIAINSKGVTIIGFYKVNNKYLNNDLLVGDKIIKINDTDISSIKELVSAIDKYVNNNAVEITYMRGKKEMTTNYQLVFMDNSYKTGLYVKDTTTGIGTLTYIDPTTNVYASLGHEILENTTKERIDIRSGYIFKSTVTDITKSSEGKPGGKNAKFYQNNIYGNVLKNTPVGIYGIYKNNIPDKNTVTVGSKKDVRIGKASIYTTLKNNVVTEHAIIIKEINEQSKIKNIYFEVTDESLINKAGGIVQGMSGSPIMQNGKIVGAVTHVIIDNPVTGYGIFIETMLTEGDTILN